MNEPIELSMHRQIHDFLQGFADRHGIRIDNISVAEWVDISSVGKEAFMIGDITITSTMFRGRGNAN